MNRLILNSALLLVLFTLFMQGILIAQAPVTIIFRDSISAEISSPFLYTSLQLENKTESEKQLKLLVLPPFGWGTIDKEILVGLQQKEKKIVPLTLIRHPSAKASWMPVNIV